MSEAPAMCPPGLDGTRTEPRAARAIGLGVLLVAGGAIILETARALRRPQPAAAPEESREAKQVSVAAGLLALSVFADSAIEHYRGSFENPGMWTPLLASGATSLLAARGALGPTPGRSAARTALFATAVVVGVGGVGFHLYNVGKRPGGYDWMNLFYAAPIGAPGALVLAGVLGLAADRIGAPGEGAPKLLGLPAGRTLAGLTAAGIAGTVSEAGLLHFRGAFQNPFMFVPVTIPPVGALLLGAAALRGGAEPRPVTKGWLLVTALVGVGGVGFHAYGVSRAMGGWYNWSQNVIDGPPLPAPPSFSALSVVGLAALSLMEKRAA